MQLTKRVFQSGIAFAVFLLIPQARPAFAEAAKDVHVNGVAVSGAGPAYEGRLADDGMDAGASWLAAARRWIMLHEYRASENATGLQAPSRRHAFRTYFEPTGIRVVDRVADGSPQLLALRLQRMGRPGQLIPVAPGVLKSNGARVEIDHEFLMEWYLNSPAGLEQGFTLPERAAGEGPVVLDLSLEGAKASGNGDPVRIATATGRRLVYGQLKAVDAAGTALPVELAVISAGRIQLRVDDTNAVYPVVIDPVLADAAATRLESDQRGALFGFAVAGAGDVNDDGYDDVIVGAWRYDTGVTDGGAVFIFHGSATGIADANPATANTRIESDQENAELGESVAGAGDVNGDGYDDVIVGAPRFRDGETEEGAAFVFLGGATGVAGATPAGAHARIVPGQALAGLGASVDGAGDVNGDGYDDVIIGAHTLDAGETDEGAAFVYLGGASGIADATPATAQTRFEGNQAEAWMGVKVAGAGDVNGDGYDDVIVGARRYDDGENDEGAAFVFYGGASGIADGNPETARTRLEGDQAGAWMGHSVAGAGDVNGDGYDDVIVGASHYNTGASFLGLVRRLLKRSTNEGAAFLFLGSASGIPSAAAADAYAAFVNDQVNANMGYGAAGAGDVNGDGFDDVIVGAYRYDCGQKNEGAAFVFPGGTRSDSGSQRGGCTVVGATYPVKKIAAAVALLLGIAGVFVFLLRRRFGARSSSS